MRFGNIDFVYAAEGLRRIMLPAVFEPVPAGFPSPAADYVEKRLDLNEHLIRHPEATFYVRVCGDSMAGAGICSGDLLVVDRAVGSPDNRIVIAVLDGEMTVKRFCRRKGKVYLSPENPEYPDIEVSEYASFEVWGVVTHVIHPV
jgi:DNA polymerase V